MEYVGEHLWIGRVGNLFVILAFISALLSTLSFFFASYEKGLNQSWKSLGRFFFRLHCVSILGIIATLFLIIFNHYFEYLYAWQHSSNALPLRYMLSCFWEGQEGSFLLWAFWHSVLGLILIRFSKDWEAP